jgi:protease I
MRVSVLNHLPETKEIVMAENTESRQTRVAILTENGFEQVELTSPKEALEKEGFIVEIVSPQREKVKGWDHDHWGIELPVDKHITEVTAEDYDGLLLPGGVLNPDQLRLNIDAVTFVKEFFASGKIIGAICHGPQILIEGNLVEGRQLTSYPSIRKDLVNAGAIWVDQEVVKDSGLVTSRKPDDLPAFNKALLEELREGKHDRKVVHMHAKS